MNRIVIAGLLAAPLLLGGCLAKTAIGIATAPVKVAAKAVDWTTTSQDEADRNAGRRLRKEKAWCRHHRDACTDDDRRGDPRDDRRRDRRED